MKKLLPHTLSCTALLLLHASAWVDPTTNTLREQRQIVINGRIEQWSLYWTGPVAPLCSGNDLDGTITCPCFGFSFGEQGHLSLARRGPDIHEQMGLSSLFADTDNPATQGNAGLIRQPATERDLLINSDDPVAVG